MIESSRSMIGEDLLTGFAISINAFAEYFWYYNHGSNVDPS